MASLFPALISLAPGARILVVGGTGVVGSGVVMALLKQGAQVVVASRCKQKFQEMYTERIPERLKCSLTHVQGDVSSEEGTNEVFRKSTYAGRGIEHVVDAIQMDPYPRTDCRPFKGRTFVDMSKQEIMDLGYNHIAGHFLLLKRFVPYLVTEPCERATYTIVSGLPPAKDETTCADPIERKRAQAQAKAEALEGGLDDEVSRDCEIVRHGFLQGLTEAARADLRMSRVSFIDVAINNCVVHPEEDEEICEKGTQHLGSDLIGSVVTSALARRFRQKIVINNRVDAKTMAQTKLFARCPEGETIRPLKPSALPACRR